MGGSRPNSSKVASIVRTLWGQYKNGPVPILSGSRPNTYVCLYDCQSLLSARTHCSLDLKIEKCVDLYIYACEYAEVVRPEVVRPEVVRPDWGDPTRARTVSRNSQNIIVLQNWGDCRPSPSRCWPGAASSFFCREWCDCGRKRQTMRC